MHLEDDIWTRIRIDPKNLPLGGIEMIPGSFFTTIRMIDLRAEKAVAELTNTQDGDGGGCLSVYGDVPIAAENPFYSFQPEFSS